MHKFDEGSYPEKCASAEAKKNPYRSITPSVSFAVTTMGRLNQRLMLKALVNSVTNYSAANRLYHCTSTHIKLLFKSAEYAAFEHECAQLMVILVRLMIPL